MIYWLMSNRKYAKVIYLRIALTSLWRRFFSEPILFSPAVEFPVSHADE
jgi:hypothetical protein